MPQKKNIFTHKIHIELRTDFGTTQFLKYYSSILYSNLFFFLDLKT